MPRLPLAALALSLALPASAQEALDQDAAKAQLFGTRSVQVAITAHPFLSEADIGTLRALPGVAQLKYYGAMAAHPSEGLQSERTRGAFNFHSIDAARAAAVAACGQGCVVVAEILPRGYEAGRSFTLNQDASKAVAGRDFRRAGQNAALAISRSTGAWGLGDGPQAAIATCAAGGASDCEVAVSR
ncbi:5-aminolevulic acid synthase [Jannaschia marina]|uniref:5-aminolevulic acid synthase n=1 Tax=Jannaschia marina TaxID=2741674 RepID=UPI0015C9BD11|nr:5-aminolevulic acid synthase [Jannaschia marina]